MAKYLYPAVFTPAEEGGYLVDFPDLEGCFTDGDDLMDAMEMAKDALCLYLYSMEQENKTIPEASDVKRIQKTDCASSFISLVGCDTIEYRKFFDKKAVKKTLSIPSWLNDMAERAEINFSATLQEALKRQLNIH